MYIYTRIYIDLLFISVCVSKISHFKFVTLTLAVFKCLLRVVYIVG